MRTKRLIGIGLLSAVAIPPLIFALVALRSGLDFGSAITALIEQYRVPRQNLGVVSGLGAAPLVLLSAILWLIRKFSPRDWDLSLFALAGLVPVLAVVAWVNLDFWPHFLPDRQYPGFPHGLGFVIGPLFFAPAGMGIGLVTAWLVLRLARPRHR